MTTANFNTTYSGESFPISDTDAAQLTAFAASNVPEPGLLLALLPVISLTTRRPRLHAAEIR